MPGTGACRCRYDRVISPGGTKAGVTSGWLRGLAAVLLATAGIVHLAQVGPHFEAGWHVAAFFVLVGLGQLVGAVFVVRWPSSATPAVLIAGSMLVVAIWIVSRTAGLPFVGTGSAEPIGVADGLASLLEAWTLIVLALVLVRPPRRRRIAHVGSAMAVAALAAAWPAAAGAGVFDLDPARLAARLPQAVDWLVVVAGVSVAGTLLALASARAALPGWQRGLGRGSIGASAMVLAALVVLTLPPTIGQNVSCDYAPLSTSFDVNHAADAERLTIAPGESRVVPVFELRACSSQAVALEHVEPMTTVGQGAEVDGFWLLAVGDDVDDVSTLPAGAEPVPPARTLPAGQSRQLVVRLTGTGDGEYILGSVLLTYRVDRQATFAFATPLAVCSGRCGAG
jgi:hypothetical protein